MDPEEAAAAAAEAALASATAGGGDPPPQEETPTGQPAGDAPTAAEEQPTPQDPPAAEDPPQPRGKRTLEARIGELSADKRRLAAENARLQAALSARGTPPAPAEGEEPAQQPQFSSQEEFERAVQEEARRRTEVEAFNSRCNAVEDAGVALGAERWSAAKRSLGLLDDNGRIPYELLSVALETDHPEQVLLTLGEDPDRAAELLRMTPTKRALEIAKMSDKTPASKPTPPPRSSAPEPIEPIQGRGAAPDRSAPTDADDDATWLRKRNQQILQRQVAQAEVLRKLG